MSSNEGEMFLGIPHGRSGKRGCLGLAGTTVLAAQTLPDLRPPLLAPAPTPFPGRAREGRQTRQPTGCPESHASRRS